MLMLLRRPELLPLLPLVVVVMAAAAALALQAQAFQPTTATTSWRQRRPRFLALQASSSDAAAEEEDEAVPFWKPAGLPTTRFAARVAYDGTRFNGFQYQPKSRTVQLELERALNATLPPALSEQLGVRPVAAGRTDSGVHARGQALHFDLPTAEVVEPRGWGAQPGKLERCLNAHLPSDVRVWNVSTAPAPAPKNLAVRGEWHAMYNAVSKLYVYRFSTRAVADPLERRTRAHVPTRAGEPALDVEKLAALAPVFEGTHDFQNFANRLEHKRRASKKGADFTTARTVYRCRLLEDDGEPGHYRLEVHLEGALQRMVRNMMGGLWSVARGDLEEAELRRALEGPPYPTGRSPIRAAPAHGLTLEWVFYDDL